DNFDLFGAPLAAPPLKEAPPPAPEVTVAPSEVEFPTAVAEPEEAALPSFAAHAAALRESPITPELNALEIVPLEGIRDRKVREIALEVPYPRVTEETVKKIREIFEDHPGEIPVSVTLINVPGSGEVRLKLNHHFRVQPGPAFSSALQQVHASPKYLF
ncbi:MAG TPA: hypothetical protein VFL80_09340, partial [Thermoanaerobaculia bacterium]|nr:hypothetical protein [Thermoanaerobaculia bacterium]